jgi:hypothetical protein
MIKPPLEKTTSQKLDQVLRKFFIEGLGYERIDNDPDEKPGDVRYWRMVVPAAKSQPFAIAYQPGLSTMERRKVSKLYIDKIIPHRDGSPAVVPSLYGFTDGVRYVFFSADPARNRDDRFDLSGETWEFAGVKDKIERLRISNLKFQERLGRKRPRVEFLFEATVLSADSRFKSYVRAMRQKLMEAIVNDRKALGAVVYHLLELPEERESGGMRFVNEDKTLRIDLEDLHLEVGLRLGDAVAAAVDTLLLRYIMVRFLEAYHPDAMEGLLHSKEILQQGKLVRKVGTAPGTTKAERTLFGGAEIAIIDFTPTELEIAEVFSRSLGIDVSKAKKKARGADNLLFDIHGWEDEELGATTMLAQEQKRKEKLGGDFYLADLGKAAQAIEEALLDEPSSRGSKLLQDFLGRTGNPQNSRWEFRYEDLRPKTLQDYYESSLGTAVQLAYDKSTDSFKTVVAESTRQRKELGAYYTEERLCRFMVEQTVKPLFEERLEILRKKIVGKDITGAREAFHEILNISVCDPTMGSAPFLRSAFDYLSEQYLRFYRAVAESKTVLPVFYEEVSQEWSFLADKGGKMDEDGVGRWEWHILRWMLYGVDFDLKAVCIACQTFALSALKYLKQGERFPSFFNLNLKLGNALISPIKPSEQSEFARKHGESIAKLIRLRRKARRLPNSDKAYDDLAKLLTMIDEIKRPIIRELVQENVAPIVEPILEKSTEELRPFCWEIEFPEQFFADDGSIKETPGFDVFIGNAPWEAFRPRDKEFFNALQPGFRYEKKEARDSRKEKLLRNLAIAKRYEHYSLLIEAQRRFVIDSGLYRLQFPVVWGERQTSDVNMFKSVLERTLELTKPRGSYFSLILQSGVSRDIGSRDLRVESVRNSRIAGIWEFRNKTDGMLIFPAVDPNQRFVLFTVQRGTSSEEVPYRYCHAFSDLTEIDCKMGCATLDLVRRISGDAFEFQTVENPVLLGVLEKLYKQPRLDDPARIHLIATMREELHTGKYGSRFLSRDTGLPLWEGSLVQRYTISAKPKRWVDPKEFAQLIKDSKYARVVIRRILPNSARRIYAGLVPPGVALADSLSYFVPTQPLAQKLFLLAYLNSLILEARLLQSVSGITLSHYRVEALPIPDWSETDSTHQRIANAVASIIVKDKRFQNEFKRNGLNVRATTDTQQTKNLIDALVAHSYGLTTIEFEAVVAEFHKVEPAIKEGVIKTFINIGGDT